MRRGPGPAGRRSGSSTDGVTCGVGVGRGVAATTAGATGATAAGAAVGAGAPGRVITGRVWAGALWRGVGVGVAGASVTVKDAERLNPEVEAATV